MIYTSLRFKASSDFLRIIESKRRIITEFDDNNRNDDHCKKDTVP